MCCSFGEQLLYSTCYCADRPSSWVQSKLPWPRAGDIEHDYALTSLSPGSYFEVIFHISLLGRTVCAAFLLNFVDKLRIFHYSHVEPFMTPNDAARQWSNRPLSYIYVGCLLESNTHMYFSLLQEFFCDGLSRTNFLGCENLPIIMPQEKFCIMMLSFIFMLMLQLRVSLKHDLSRSYNFFFFLSGIKSLMFQNQMTLNTKVKLQVDCFLKFVEKY